MRLTAAGLAEHCSYHLPLTQEGLSDVLGMTAVHMNRMLRELRERDLVTFKGSMVEIHDWDRLVEFTEFDPFYLSLHQRPR